MKRAVIGAAVAIGVVAAAWWLWTARQSAFTPGNPEYERVVAAFYRGVAALDTGLLDDARTAFTSAAQIVPTEPAAWANLAVTQLRGAQFDAAAASMERALTLAPDDSQLVSMHGRLDIARGRLDTGITALRRAVQLDGSNVRARFALAEALERAGGADAEAEAQRQLTELAALLPGSLALDVERARAAVRRRDASALNDVVVRLDAQSRDWPAQTRAQLDALRNAAATSDYAAAGRAVAFLRNLLAQSATYRESLAVLRVPAELIVERLDRFVMLPPVTASPSPADTTLAYASEPLSDAPASNVAVFPADANYALAITAAGSDGLRRLDTPGAWPFRAGTAMLPLDWNHDFRSDLVVAEGSSVALLVQNASGGFDDATEAAGLTTTAADVTGAWTADLDMDGDLDLIVGTTDAPLVLRNNGDGTSRALPLFAEVRDMRGFAWADLDADGDPDPALLDGGGRVTVLANQQAGVFAPIGGPDTTSAAIIAGDVDADGVIDLVSIDRAGVVRRHWRRGAQWTSTQIAAWMPAPTTAPRRLVLADLDNNGALDVVASGEVESRVWLAGSDALVAQARLTGTVSAAVDLTGDGRLDLVGVADGRPVRYVARASQAYHWQVIRARAQTAAGDQRINAFGVGGDIEVRSGLLMQKQLLTGMPVHVGLGGRTTVDVARIVWPNGVMQAEFDLRADQPVVAEQRLKGSCPWVFTDNGSGMTFVTDFLWRSPLGLRINAQDTAGITQTEDWIRIRGDQLAPRDGRYDVRITAELWETHFFDHVSLMAVDHPVGTEMVVDERFARQPPSLAVHLFNALVPVASARDQGGADLTELVTMRDGRHAAGFDRGRYQGVAAPHAIEFELGPGAPDIGPLSLVASGWVYPTDSSINVAIAQGSAAPPQSLALDVLENGRWRELAADLGFPAGKNKTVLIDLSRRPSGARRFRLRTNLEIYWDQLAWATPASNATTLRRLAAATADLRYRGFSRTTENRAEHAPEVPSYDSLAGVSQRWRDLVGYHTRFGDVRELLSTVDDRYVIMNAGDEMRLTFDALPPPPDGWTRDFVLIGDGWEKDGDFNTGYSKTVLPLPRHGYPEYTASSLQLEDDPAYRRYPADWLVFHTRFVSPDRYLRGLRASD